MALTDEDIRQAEERTAVLRRKGYAVSARYDAPSDRVVIELSTGMQIAFPPRLAEGLADAGVGELAMIEISPSGLGLHWPLLDADLSVPSLLQGNLGSEQWMTARRATAGAQSRPGAKGAGAREGHRPRKLAIGPV